MSGMTTSTTTNEELGLEVIEEVLTNTETFTKFWDGSTMKGSPAGRELVIKAVREHDITEMFRVIVNDYQHHLTGQIVLRCAIERIWVAGRFHSPADEKPTVAAFVERHYALTENDGKILAATKAEALAILVAELEKIKAAG